LANPDNNGLAPPIAALAPVVAKYENKTAGVSRADIWALAAVIGGAVAKNGGEQVNFTQNWFGRVNCEDANSVCTNAAGAVVSCSATAGPARSLPSPNLDTDGVFSFFNQTFGFDQRQTVAIMGAHTVGRALQNVSSDIGRT
jgi:catalase (peroxidase I)